MRGKITSRPYYGSKSIRKWLKKNRKKAVPKKPTFPGYLAFSEKPSNPPEKTVEKNESDPRKLKRWTVVARYCSTSAQLLPRIAVAVSAEEAGEKAKKRFPLGWCGYKLTQIFVLPYTPIYKGIKVRDALENRLPKFNSQRYHPGESAHKIQRSHRIRHVTGKNSD